MDVIVALAETRTKRALIFMPLSCSNILVFFILYMYFKTEKALLVAEAAFFFYLFWLSEWLDYEFKKIEKELEGRNSGLEYKCAIIIIIMVFHYKIFAPF